MRKIIAIFTILLGFSGFAQQSDTGAKLGMKAVFSAPAISAYQESAVLKITDFYQYLEILSDQNTSLALQAEVRTNIFSLFESNTILIDDLFSNSGQKISLSAFLDGIARRNLKFKVRDFGTDSKIQPNHWQHSYTVDFLEGGISGYRKISQKVYFTPRYKQFGSTQKEVWAAYLGEMEFARF